MGDLPAGDDHDLVRQTDDALLMGDDDHGGPVLPVDLLEGLRQAGEAPQVDAGLRLVEDHEAALPGQNGGDLDALDLAAGEGHIHLTLQIVVGAQAHTGQVLAALVLGERFLACRQKQQVMDGDALEAGGLLEAVADAQSGPLRDGEVGDILPIIQDLARCGLRQPHDDLGHGGLAAAVGAGKDHQLLIGNGDADVLEDVLLPVGGGHPVTDVFQFQHGTIPPLEYIGPRRKGRDRTQKALQNIHFSRVFGKKQWTGTFFPAGA